MSDELDVRIKTIIEANEAESAKRIKGQIPGIENAIKDKPIKVSVEMQESSSAKNIKGQIKNLETALKTKSLKIQLGVDIAASMRAIKSAIPILQDALKGAPVKIPFVVDPKSLSKATQQAAKAAQEAAEKATSSSKGGTRTSSGSDNYQARILQKRAEGLQYAVSKAGLPKELDWSGYKKAFDTGDIKAARSEFRLLSLEFSNLNQQVRGGINSQLKELPQKIQNAAIAAAELANKFASIKKQGGIIPDDSISRIDTLKTKLSELAQVKPEEMDTKVYLETFRNLEGELQKIKGVYKETLGTFTSNKLDIGADKLNTDVERIKQTLLNMKTNWSAMFGDKNLSLQWDSLWKKASSGAITTTAEVSALRSEVGLLNKQVEGAGLNTKTFFGQIGSNLKKFSQWFFIGNAVATSVRAMREMFDAVKSVDSAMVSLKKVTNETDSTYSNFLKNAKTDAVALGTTVANLIQSTANFARLGYNISDSTELGKVATLYYNVGDGLGSVDDATQDIISSLKAFSIQSSDAITIVDKLNRVGNEFSITSGGIGEALKRSAASLAEANNDINQSIALNVAANNVVQDPEVVGGLRLVA